MTVATAKPAPDPRELAWHEAGHAVMAWERGHEVRWLSLEKVPGRLGGMMLAEASYRTIKIRDLVLCLVAGLAATRLAGCPDGGWGWDWGHAWAACGRSSQMADLDRREEYLDQCLEAATLILSQPAVWRATQALAWTLEVRGRLTGAEAKSIYDQARSG